MLKILTFAVCEKIIIDDNNNASLVVLMQNIHGSLIGKKDVEIPKNAISPQAWAVYAIWTAAQEDIGKSFVQTVQVFWPDKSEFKRAEVPFTVTERTHQNRINVIGFPIGQPGTVIVRLWLEENSKPITEPLEWPINVALELGDKDERKQATSPA